MLESPKEIRKLTRNRKYTGPTSGLAEGYTQANLIILPNDMAFDFLLFCQRNPKPCPLLEVTAPGEWEPKQVAPGADLRVDLPSYRVFRNGEFIAEEKEITKYWSEDLVCFLLGCSFTFEFALMRAGIPVRNIEEKKIVSMFITNIQLVPSGVFSGPMVVTMRPIPRKKVVRCVQITSRFPLSHGAPVHIGDPKLIGIDNITHPDYGNPIAIRENEIPVFWACGVTSEVIAVRAKPRIMITHSPGCMFITDVLDEELAII